MASKDGAWKWTLQPKLHPDPNERDADRRSCDPQACHTLHSNVFQVNCLPNQPHSCLYLSRHSGPVPNDDDKNECDAETWEAVPILCRYARSHCNKNRFRYFPPTCFHHRPTALSEHKFRNTLLLFNNAHLLTQLRGVWCCALWPWRVGWWYIQTKIRHRWCRTPYAEQANHDTACDRVPG